MTNSIDLAQWLNVTSESRDIMQPFFFALGRNRTHDPRVPGPKRTPLGYILPKELNYNIKVINSLSSFHYEFFEKITLQFLP
jgi:hypothetical protein